MYQIKEIPGFKGYLADTKGKIYSLFIKLPARQHKGWIYRVGTEKKKLKGMANKDGYYRYCLFQNGKRFYRSGHRLVLETFVGLGEGKVTRHLNGVRNDNRLENLKWGTVKENHLDRLKHGNLNWHKGDQCWNTKLTEKKVRIIKHALSYGAWQKHLSQMFQISQGIISEINTGKRWKHVLN